MKVLTRRRINTLFVTLALLASALPAAAAQLPAPTVERRNYVTGKFALLLGGEFVGILPAVSGGFAVGGPVVEEPGGGFLVKKRLDEPVYSDITLVFGAGMSRSLYEWIERSLRGGENYAGGGYEPVPRDGSIIALDSNYRAVRRLDFSHAFMTELGIPRLTAGAKEELLFRLTIKPEHTVRVKASGQYQPRCKLAESPLAGNFRLTLGGLETSKVSVVEPLSVKLPLPPEDRLRDGVYPRQTLRINFPNLELSFPASSPTAESFDAWALHFLREGLGEDFGETVGSVEFLARDMSTPFFTLVLGNVGMYSLEPPEWAGAPGQSPSAWARMYVEQMEFRFGGAATLGTRGECGKGEPVQTH